LVYRYGAGSTTEAARFLGRETISEMLPLEELHDISLRLF
jgi:hypothetical protein